VVSRADALPGGVDVHQVGPPAPAGGLPCPVWVVLPHRGSSRASGARLLTFAQDAGEPLVRHSRRR
jgi:hypothetical protein